MPCGRVTMPEHTFDVLCSCHFPAFVETQQIYPRNREEITSAVGLHKGQLIQICLRPPSASEPIVPTPPKVYPPLPVISTGKQVNLIDKLVRRIFMRINEISNSKRINAHSREKRSAETSDSKLPLEILLGQRRVRSCAKWQLSRSCAEKAPFQKTC